jgi:hypothetical protein
MDDIDYITDDIQAIKKQNKAGHTRKAETKRIKVRSSVEVARDNYRASKRLHRKAIKGLKNTIRIHKLQIRQAKDAYKLVKLSK